MACEIRWSEIALDSYKNIIDYLKTEWTDREVNNFNDTLQFKLNVLQELPYIGTAFKKRKHTYKTVLHKRVVLIYHYNSSANIITLVLFWETRQNPVKLRIME